MNMVGWHRGNQEQRRSQIQIMNDNHLQQIFTNYVQQFERINNTTHREYYKWQIIKVFRQRMDETLKASSEEFPAMLYKMKKLSENLIDNYTQPFHGLVKFAEHEPDTVREMFIALYSDDNGDIEIRKKKVSDFLRRSHELRDKYYPDSYLYKDDMHSVTGYLFLYDPDHNYIYKATHALAFADCVEFYDDWGWGDSVKLDVYYRMCDQLVEAAKSDAYLMAADERRFTDCWGQKPESLHPDLEKHILAFDLIYCCSTYGLFKGITFERPKSKDRQVMQERKEKARELKANYDDAREQEKLLEEAKEYVNSVLCEGVVVHHKKFGDGTITGKNGSGIEVLFENGERKKLGTFVSVANGLITTDAEGFVERIEEYRDLLKKEKSITAAVGYAERQLSSCIDYLD